MKTRRNATKNTRRLSICATSIAAFMAASPESPGNPYDVNLGDTFIENGLVTGPTGLNKTGGGALVLTNAGNNYTGTTMISDGTVVISVASALGADTSEIIITGANPNPASTNLRGFGGGSLFLNGAAGGITISRDLSLQGYGPISDRGASLLSTGNNTLSGTITTGVLSSSVLPGAVPINTRLISVDGTLNITGTLNVGGTATTTITSVGGTNQAGASFYNLTGVLTGTGTLETSGGGALILSPSDTSGFNGTVRVTGSAASGQSTLRITSDNVLGTRNNGGTAAVLDMNGGILVVLMDTPAVNTSGTPANVYGRAASTFFVDHAPGTLVQNGTLDLGTFLFEEVTQTFNSRNGYNISFGATTVNGGTNNSTFNNNLQGGGLLTFTGNFWNNNDNGGNRTHNFGGNGNTLIDGNINGASAGFSHNVTKTGTGTLTITGTNSTMDGAFNINGGTVAVNGFGAFGPAASTAAINIGTGTTAGTLTYLGNGETVTRQINVASTSGASRINASGTGPLILSTALTVNQGAATTASKTFTLGGTSTADNEFAGAIPNGGTTPVNVTKADEGVWVLSGNNTYTGNTTITEGRLKVKATGAGATNVIQDSSNLIFAQDNTDQSAAGTFEYVGAAGQNNVETLGVLTPTLGYGRIRLTPGAGGEASLVFSSLGGISSTGATINVITPSALSTVTITAQPTGFVRGSVYYNGDNFAYSASGVLRAPVYGTDPGFVTSASALTDANHNEITGNVTLGAPANINSLKISGSQTIDVGANLLTINNGSNTTAGILVNGGNATITGTGGVTQGLGTGGNGGGEMVIRVVGASDTLDLATPITNSTTGGLTKSGLGTLILSAQNNQNGTTDILEGTIQLATGGRLSPANRSLTIRKLGTLDLNGISTGTSVAAFNGTGNVTNTSLTPAVFQVGNNNGTGLFSGVISDGASQISVVKTGTGTQTWNSLTGANSYTGSTTFLSTGLVSVDLLTNIGTPSSLGAGDATSDATNAASLFFGGGGGTAPAGVPAGISSAAAGINFVSTSTMSTDRLFTLSGTAIRSGARILGNGANAAAVIFTNTNPIAYTAGASTAAQTLILAGGSSGDNGINLQLTDPAGNASAVLHVRKQEAGTWNLGNTGNNYNGWTIINQGRLVAGSSLALPSSSPLVFTAVNADLDGGVFHSNGNFTRTVTATPTNGVGTVSFLAEGLPNTRAGSGGFAAVDGKFTVNLGPQTWNSGGFMQSGSAAATLRLNSAVATNHVELTGDINLNGAQREIQVDDNTNIGADYATLSGVLSGVGAGIDKSGTGILVLSGANTYTGNTNVTVGTLVVSSLGNSGSPGASSVGDSTAGNTNAGAVTLGNATVTGGAILEYVGPGETSDRKIRLNAIQGNTQIHADGTGPLILTNVANDMLDGNKTLFLRGSNAAGNRIDSILSDAPSSGTLNVQIDGSATWILNAVNTYSGNTTASAGALGIGNNAALGSSTLVLSNGNLFAAGADRVISNTVNLNNGTTQGILGDFSLTFSSGLNANAAAANVGINNNIAAGESLTINGVTANTMTANRVLTIDGSGLTVINGDISNTSTSAFGLTVTKSGLGELVLNGTGSNFTRNGANLDIDSGTVTLGASGVIPDGAGFGDVLFSPDNNQNETATLNLNGFSETINGLIGTNSSASTIDNASGTPVTLTVGAGDGTINSNAAITASGGGAISIVKTGAATGPLAQLSGTSITIGGTINIQSGALAFTGDDPETTTGITVAGGAGLSFINGLGSNFASLASLSVGGAGTTELGLDVGAITDTLAIAGAASAAGAINLAIGAAPGLTGGMYTLLQASGGLTSGGATYALSAVPGGFTFTLTATDTSVVLNAVPTAIGTFFWTGDQDNSWATFNAGNTNWEDGSQVDTASTPGPDDVVVFSSAVNLPPPVFITTLDQAFTIDSLQFNGNNTGVDGARVTIAPGVGGTLTINPDSSADGIEISDGGGVASITAPITLAGDQTWTVGSLGTPRPELIVPGLLTGPGNLTKLGAGTATVTGANLHTGRTSIEAGTLRINLEAALGSEPGSFVANQLNIDGGTLRSTAAFTFSNANRGIRIGSLGGSIDTTGGNITVNSNIVIDGTSGGTLRKEGGNTLIMNAAIPTLTGGLFINGGAFRAGDNGAAGPAGITLGNTATVLEVADGVNVSNAILASDTGNDKTLRLLNGAASGQISGPVTIQETAFGNFRVQASGSGVLTVSGALLEGTGTVARGVRVNEVAANTGTVIFSSPATSDTYTGTTEVRNGLLINGANDVIGTSTAATALTVNATIAASPDATYSTGDFNETVGNITFGANASSTAAYVNTVTTGTGTLTLGGNVTTVANPAGSQVSTAVLSGNVAMAATRTFNVADATSVDTDLLVSAAISGGGGLTKTGAGTLELAAANTYTGATTVNAGTILLTGSISASPLVVNSGGVVAPGGSIGTSTAASLTMNGTSTFELEINTTTQQTDLLNTTGPLTLDLANTVVLDVIDEMTSPLALGERFTFITYGGSGWNGGLFSVGGNAISDDVESFLVGANLFAIDYNDVGGTAVSLVVVPEPGIAASLLGGFGMLMGLQRIRRRSDRRA